MKKETKNKNEWETVASAPIEVTAVTFNWISDNIDDDMCIAMGTVVLNNAISINIRIIDTETDRFVSMPTVKNGRKYFNLVFISDVKVKDTIEKIVLEQLEKELSEQVAKTKKSNNKNK